MTKKSKKIRFVVPDDFGENVEILFHGKWCHGYFDDEEGGVYYFYIYAHENPQVKIPQPLLQLTFIRAQMTEDKIRRYVNA